MNRLNKAINKHSRSLLSIYYTAGFPNLNDTVPIGIALEKEGADIIEIGMPYSDPVADGPIIQASNQQSLVNGMTLKLLLEQVKELRMNVSIPIILMGYVNPVLQYGMEAFCSKCQQVGVDGVILPDLPLEVYEAKYKNVFKKYGVKNIFLITPQTSIERIESIDKATESFIYMVSSSSITGARTNINGAQTEYFRKIKNMNLDNPTLVGFGISDSSSFRNATEYSNGAIIGSAFIKLISKSKELENDIRCFMSQILVST